MPRRFIQKTQTMSILTLVTIFLSAAIFGALFEYAYLSKSNQARNCRAALDVRDAMVFVISDAKRQSHQFGTATKRSDLFYDRANGKLKAVRCNPKGINPPQTTP